MKLGYERKQEQTKELNLEAWRRARMTAYVSAKPYLSNKNIEVWEFMPLPGDPTEEDIEVLKIEKAKEAQRQIAEALQQYRSMGLEVPDIKFIA